MPVTPRKSAASQDTSIELIELTHAEVQLLKALRNTFKFGEVTVIMRDGVPIRLRRIVEFADLA